MSEFLTDGFKKALGWSALLGLPTPNLSYIPITADHHNGVETKSYERFYPIANGLLAFHSIYSCQNTEFNEQSYGIQVMAPFNKRNSKPQNMEENTAVIQWKNLTDDNRQIVTVDLENFNYRYISLYYENGPKILRADQQTKGKLELIAYLNHPNGLARLILNNQINVNDFDLMLSKLTG